MIVLLLLLLTPVVLITGALAEKRRRPKLDVDVGRLRFRPRRGIAAWLMAWTGTVLLTTPVALFLFVTFSSGLMQTPMSMPCNDPDGNCLPLTYEAWWAFGVLLIPVGLWVWSWAASLGRLRPAEIVLDPVHLHLDQRSLPLATLRSVRITGPGNPWTYRSLVLQTDDSELVVAVDGDRLDALNTVVDHIERQAATATDAPAAAEVPSELTKLRSADAARLRGSTNPDR